MTVLSLDSKPDACVALIEYEVQTSLPEEEQPIFDVAEVISKATEELFSTTWKIFNTESPRKFLRVFRIPHSAIDLLRDLFYLCGVLCAWFIADYVLNVEPQPKVLGFNLPVHLLESEPDRERCNVELEEGRDALQVKSFGEVAWDVDQGYETSEDLPADLSMVSSSTKGVAPTPPELSPNAENLEDNESIVAPARFPRRREPRNLGFENN